MRHINSTPKQSPDILLVLFIIASYTKIHLSIPGFGVPYFFAHLAAIFYLRKRNHLNTMVNIMLPWCVFLFAHFIISAKSPIPGKDDIQIFAYNLLNLFSVFTLFLMLRLSDIKNIENLSRLLMVILIILGVIEIYGGAKDFFDSIRSIYTSESSIYTAEERDLSQYGALRPSVFTSEPSSVGNFFGSLWILYLSISKSSSKKILECVILMVIAIFLFRTPTLAIYTAVGITLYIYIFAGNRRHISWFIIIPFLFVLIFAPYYLQNNDVPFLGENDSVAEFVSTGSFYIRQIIPVENFLYMLRDNPFFGYGYSYFEQMKSNNWAELNNKNPIFYDHSRISEMHGGQFITNAFWEFWILNGIVGGCIVLAYIWAVIKNNGGTSPGMLAVCGACVWISHAGVSLIFTWIPIVFMAYALSIKYPSRINEVEQRNN